MKNFDRKFFVGLVFIVLLFLPMLGGALYSLKSVVSDQNELISKYTEILFLAKDLRLHIIEQASDVPLYVLSGDPQVLRDFEKANYGFANTATRLTNLITDPEETEILHRITKLKSQLEELAKPGIEMKKRGVAIDLVHSYFGRTTGKLSMELEGEMRSFGRHARAAFEHDKEENDKISSRLLHFLAAASLLTFLFGLMAAGLLVKLVRQKKLADEVDEKLAAREKQLSNVRKEVIEVVAHDLKNPLTSIIMSADLAIRQEARAKSGQSTTDIAPVIEVIARSARSMKRLIDDLLDHTKIESADLVLTRAECNFDFLLQTLVARFRPIALNKKIHFDADLSEHLPCFELDEVRLEQVLSNLLGNAFKFTPAGGTIRIHAKHIGNEVLVSVSDTGSGIEPEQLDHIFERYWQVRETASQGTGLGLAISKAIIQAHEGKIWVESEVGKGSTFWISVPCRTQTTAQIPEHSETRPPYLKSSGSSANRSVR